MAWRVRDLLQAGTPVALVIGDVGEGDRAGGFGMAGLLPKRYGLAGKSGRWSLPELGDCLGRGLAAVVAASS